VVLSRARRLDEADTGRAEIRQPKAFLEAKIDILQTEEVVGRRAFSGQRDRTGASKLMSSKASISLPTWV
jgi:hypothetical protein